MKAVLIIHSCLSLLASHFISQLHHLSLIAFIGQVYSMNRQADYRDFPLDYHTSILEF